MDVAAELPNFYALLVIRDQKIVAEAYYKGRSADDLFHLRSITKNFTSAATGITLEEGKIADVDASLQPYYPDLLQGEKAGITIRQLLNMASGLEWDEEREVIPLIEHRVPDPISYLLTKPLVDTPAVTFNYNSLSPHVVADVLVRETGTPLPEIVETRLFKPLGIERYAWTTDPKGAAWGGFGLQLRARDLAKFGQMYLNGGRWESEQLVPAAWVEQSERRQIQFPGSTGGYSYQWWISNTLDSPLYYGQGYGGQALMLMPEKNMLVVAFQEYFVDGEQQNRQWRNFVDQVFLPIYGAAE